MANYILISCLLSTIGGFAYFGLLRQRLQVLQAKYVLLGIILLSWMMPLLVPSIPNYTSALEKQYLFDYREYNQWNVVDLEDDELLACYEQADNSKEQCNCEIQQQSDVLYYQSNAYYNFIITCKTPVCCFFVLIMGLFLIDLLLKLACLIYLVATSPREQRQLAGTTFYILRPQQKIPLAISSFSLIKHYVIAHPSLEERFSAEEMEAILLHEVAHLQQRDTWQQLLLHSLKLVWWMLPMYYWMKKELNRLNEYVADDFAVQHIGNSKFYAQTLLKAKEQQIQHQQLNLVMYFAQSLLKQRIVRLVKPTPQHYKPYWTVALLFIGVIFWNTSVVAIPMLQEQDIAIKQYEVLQEKNSVTGQYEFCQSCIAEELKQQN